MSEDFLADAPQGLWPAGAYLATFGACGGVLTLGLTQGWGVTFPRWMIGVRARQGAAATRPSPDSARPGTPGRERAGEGGR